MAVSWESVGKPRNLRLYWDFSFKNEAKLASWDLPFSETSLLHQGIDLLNGGVLLSSEGQVDHGDVRCGHALPNRLGINEAWGCGEGNMLHCTQTVE